MKPLLRLAILAPIVLASACHGGVAGNPPIVSVPNGLYVANFSNNAGVSPGTLLEFSLPFTNNEAPKVSIAPPASGEAPEGMLLDSNHQRLYVGYYKFISVYKLPLTPSSMPLFSIPTGITGNEQGLALDSSGNLMVGIDNNVYLYPTPLSSSSTASFHFTLPNGAGCCLQEFAVHGTTLAIATDIGSNDHVYVYSLPLTAASTPTASITTGATQSYGGVAFDSSGNLYATGVNPKRIEIYDPPLSSASVPATEISLATFNLPGELGFDSLGNLYAEDQQPAVLYEYSPPFTAASTPAAQTTISLGQLIAGIASGT